MNPDRNTAERLDEVRSRISTMLALADVLGSEIGPEEIREAALVHLEPAAEMFAAYMLGLVQVNLWAATLILAGQVDGKLMAPTTRRPRRPRPTAAERRAQAATEFLNGPAWEIMDGPEPEPSPDGGCP